MKGFVQWALRSRGRLEEWLGEREWRDAPDLLPRAEVGREIRNAIETGTPFAAGKVGANEQVLLRWAERMPIRAGLYVRPMTFHNTRFSLTNAGLRPRTEESYREFGAILRKSVAETDLMGVWRGAGERDLYRRCGFHGRIGSFFDLDPWFMDEPWSAAMAGKKVFAISPFLRLFKDQLAAREKIWPGRGVLPEIRLAGYEFPYLIDPDSTLNWKDVWQDVLEAMKRAEPDVVLAGCGALGLPLVVEAKRMGAVGVHLGGMLQILFGVRGKRYDDADNYRELVNDAWIRPPESFRPARYQSVEDGCYW